jgi:hypothetical protein
MAINTGDLLEAKGAAFIPENRSKNRTSGRSQSVHSSASKPQGPQERAPRNEGE